MAAPKDAPEQAFRLRRFQGTNVVMDPVFLGSSVVALSQNWVPAQSYRLGKRPGTTQLATFDPSPGDITSLLAARDASGGYLYAYGRRTSIGDAHVYWLKDETLPVNTTPPNVSFPNATAVGRLIKFRDRVYVGNGVDPIVSFKIGTHDQVQTYGTLSTTSPAGTLATPAASAATPAFPSGSYSYCWAIYDTVTGLYVSRTTTATILVPAQTVLQVTMPAAALGANQVYRFFLAPRGYPIEYATAQGGSLPASATFTLSVMDVTDLRVPIAGVSRTGNMFVIWRNRVVFAGMASDPTSAFATDVILPGLEEAAYNQGTLFPLGAKVKLPDTCTGVGIAGVTSEYEAQAPLLFFTNTRTFMCTGDPFDPNDQNATLVELSSRVGCIGHDSIVNTPFGTIFCGIDSIYLIPPGGGYPEDIGWPIGKEVKRIPPSLRSGIRAVFHRNFYKLAIPPGGGTQNEQQWWLDLRQGVGSTPSWWGPHRMDGPSGPIGLSAFTVDLGHPTEYERCYAAMGATFNVLITHQERLFSDLGQPVISLLRSGRFDADEPFIVKIVTRLRLITQSAGPGQIAVSITTDGGVIWVIDPINLAVLPDDMGAQWQRFSLPTPRPSAPNQQWTSAKWRSVAPVEAQTITPYARPRGLAVEAALTHKTAQGVELRDFEILAILTERKVRYVATSRFPQERVSK